MLKVVMLSVVVGFKVHEREIGVNGNVRGQMCKMHCDTGRVNEA
jgi:hypothetical protein